MADASTWSAVLALVIGLVVAFAGYRLARSLAWLGGFIAGFSIGLVLGAVGGPLVALAAALLLGVVLGVIGAFAFRFVGAVLGLAAGISLGMRFGLPSWGIALAAIGGGVLGLVANKPVLVVATALIGSALVLGSVMELLGLGWFPIDDELVAQAVVLLGVAGLGALVQWRSVRYED